MRGLAALVLVAFLAAGCGGDHSRKESARLLFVAGSNGYVSTIGADGRGLRQLTRGDEWGAVSGSWSPDSSKIAVVTEKVPEGRQAALLLMNPDGTSRRRLAFLPSFSTSLRWLREGKIEARSYVAHRQVAVLEVDVDQGGRRSSASSAPSKAVRSPDGRFEALVRANAHGDMQINVRRVGGGSAVNISRSRSVGPTRLVESTPAWSPDGSQVAFTLDRGLAGDTREIRVMSSGGSNERTLAQAPRLRVGPEWSPDGRLVAYVADADDDGLDELYVVGIDGNAPRKLVERVYIQDLDWQKGPPVEGPPERRSAPARTRLVRTYSSEFADGHARLVDVRLLDRFSSARGRPDLADLSPDGSLAALFSAGKLELLDLRTNRRRVVAPARPAGWSLRSDQALFSAAGNELLYRRWAQLRTLDVGTGRTRIVATGGSGSFAWLRDGRIAFDDRGLLKIVRPGRGASRVEGIPRVERWAISPGGRRLLYDHGCETFLLDRKTDETRRISGHMFVVPRSWSPDGTHFVLQWAEECNRKTGAIWAYHTYDILYNRAGDRITGHGIGATWSRDSSALLALTQPTGTATGGLQALSVVDLKRRRQSKLLREGNADSNAFLGPGGWVLFARYDNPHRVPYGETSGGLYVGRVASG